MKELRQKVSSLNEIFWCRVPSLPREEESFNTHLKREFSLGHDASFVFNSEDGSDSSRPPRGVHRRQHEAFCPLPTLEVSLVAALKGAAAQTRGWGWNSGTAFQGHTHTEASVLFTPWEMLKTDLEPGAFTAFLGPSSEKLLSKCPNPSLWEPVLKHIPAMLNCGQQENAGGKVQKGRSDCTTYFKVLNISNVPYFIGVPPFPLRLSSIMQ